MSDRADRRLRLARPGPRRDRRRDPDASAYDTPDEVVPVAVSPLLGLESLLIVEDALLHIAARLRDPAALDTQERQALAARLDAAGQGLMFVGTRMTYQLAAAQKESHHD